MYWYARELIEQNLSTLPYDIDTLTYVKMNLPRINNISDELWFLFATHIRCLTILLFSWWRPQCGLKASRIYLRSSSSICSSDVYRQQSGWCRYLSSILTHFLTIQSFNEWLFYTYYSFIYIFYFWLRKTAVPVKIFRYSFRVFSCACPTVISSISGKSFHFPFPYFVRIRKKYK